MISKEGRGILILSPGKDKVRRLKTLYHILPKGLMRMIFMYLNILFVIVA